MPVQQQTARDGWCCACWWQPLLKRPQTVKAQVFQHNKVFGLRLRGNNSVFFLWREGLDLQALSVVTVFRRSLQPQSWDKLSLQLLVNVSPLTAGIIVTRWRLGTRSLRQVINKDFTEMDHCVPGSQISKTSSSTIKMWCWSLQLLHAHQHLFHCQSVLDSNTCRQKPPLLIMYIIHLRAYALLHQYLWILTKESRKTDLELYIDYGFYISFISELSKQQSDLYFISTYSMKIYICTFYSNAFNICFSCSSWLSSAKVCRTSTLRTSFVFCFHSLVVKPGAARYMSGNQANHFKKPLWPRCDDMHHMLLFTHLMIVSEFKRGVWRCDLWTQMLKSWFFLITVLQDCLLESSQQIKVHICLLYRLGWHMGVQLDGWIFFFYNQPKQ